MLISRVASLRDRKSSAHRPVSVLVGAQRAAAVFHGAEGDDSFVLRKSRFWDAHKNHAFNERQRTMINRLFDGFEGKLTSSKWAKIAKSSQDTALRDIDSLVKRGVLVKEPGGGRSTSYGLAEKYTK